jgi:hypothetical protein
MARDNILCGCEECRERRAQADRRREAEERARYLRGEMIKTKAKP